MTFTEEWFSEAACECLATLARHTDGVPGLVVEIGSWEGRSTLALADAVAPAIVHAVDTWNGSPGEISAELAAQRDVFATFLANTEGRNVEPHRMDWRWYVEQTTAPFRFVFVDAEHSYEEVRDTIRAVLPRMSPGGILCGDDNHYPPVKKAVIECLGPHTPVVASLWYCRL